MCHYTNSKKCKRKAARRSGLGDDEDKRPPKPVEEFLPLKAVSVEMVGRWSKHDNAVGELKKRQALEPFQLAFDAEENIADKKRQELSKLRKPACNTTCVYFAVSCFDSECN